jgi:hypothetical protein
MMRPSNGKPGPAPDVPGNACERQTFVGKKPKAKIEEWQKRTYKKTTRVRVKAFAILVGLEKLAVANVPGGISHMQQSQGEFFKGLSFGGVEVSSSYFSQRKKEKEFYFKVTY